MNRRTYITSLAAIAASTGCIESMPGQTSPDTMRRTVSVENVAEDEAPPGIQFDVEISDAEITTDATARIALGYENAGEEPRELNINPEGPDPLSSEDEDPAIVLLSDAYDPARSSADCWKPEQDGFPQPAVVHRHELDPGERATLEYEVWADPQQEAGCIRRGTYQFEPLYGTFSLAISRSDDGT